jgi:drug/metabolite transporter (DMT)-like permease
MADHHTEQHMQFFNDKKYTKFLDVDEAMSLVIQLLLWCSTWGVIDAMVQQYSEGNEFISSKVYMLVSFFGCFGYILAIRNKRRVSILHPGIFEFLTLVTACVGSWGTVNSMVTVIAKPRKINEALVHGGVLLFSIILAFWHHTFRKPNFIIDQLLD